MSLTGDSIALLGQADDLLERIDESLLRATAPGFESGSIGAQLRHVLDSYGCFLLGLESGQVDYERRERDLAVESEIEACRARVAQVTTRLGQVADDASRRPVQVRCDTDGCAGAPGVASDSTVRRELQFLMSHVIHHFALIAVILRLHDFDPGETFGVAPSTLAHWKRSSEHVG